MKLSNQVCSIEQAKKLKELGIEQSSFHHWIHEDENKFIVSRTACFAPAPEEWGECYSAYSVSELGIMLPPHFPTFVHDGGNHCHCRNERVDTFPLNSGETEYDVTPAHILNKELIPITTGNTEAEARAEMLIYLLESNIVTASEANKKLLNDF